MCCLHLRKIWDQEEPAFYLQYQRCYTPEGLHAYWLSIDASIKFWHKTLCEILMKKQKKVTYSLKNRGNLPAQSSTYNKSVKELKKKQKTHHNTRWNKHQDIWKKNKFNDYPSHNSTGDFCRKLPKPPF